MTLDPSIPSHLVESPGGAREDYEPRATRLETPRLLSVRTRLWMGGVHTTMGDAVVRGDLGAAWVVDCTGEMPSWVGASSQRYIPRVFTDTESIPPNIGRIESLVEELAEVVSSFEGPERIYLMCKQGLNRSGLISALLLRTLGMSSDEAVALIRAARPGALNNVTFVDLVGRGGSHLS